MTDLDMRHLASTSANLEDLGGLLTIALDCAMADVLHTPLEI